MISSSRRDIFHFETQNPGKPKTTQVATPGALQTRHVRNRCGLSQARAHLVAALLFGEGTR